LPELKSIRERGGALEIGAMVRHSEIESSELLRRVCPLLPETARVLGDLQVRNRGTIGGSLAHADPAGDWPAAILALDATLIASSINGQRRITAQDFFTDLMTTALQPNEILSSIEIPKLPANAGVSYLKMRQQASGFAIVGVAAVLIFDRTGKMEDAHVGITGVGPFPYRAHQVEQRLRGAKPSSGDLTAAAEQATSGVEVSSDIHASSEYRRAMACVFTRRALERAVQAAPRS
jgi:carbon-monoxide dehydrogenase medium subunit